MGRSGGGRSGGFSGGRGFSGGGRSGSFSGGHRSSGRSSSWRSSSGGSSSRGSFFGGGAHYSRSHDHSSDSGSSDDWFLPFLVGRASAGGGNRHTGYSGRHYNYTSYSNGDGGYPSGAQGAGSTGCGCVGFLWAAIVLLVVLVLLTSLASSCSSQSGGSQSGGSQRGVAVSTVEREPLAAGTAVVGEWYTDDDGDWIHDSGTLLSGMREFYNETGVAPYLHILPNGSRIALEDTALEDYTRLFDDDAHFVLVFVDDNNGGYDCGYYVGKAAETVLDDEALTIFAQFLEKNYDDYSISEEEIFSKTYAQTAERIMSVHKSPWPTVIMVIAIVGGVGVVAFVVFRIVKSRHELEERKSRRTEDILSTPLETYGQAELDELEQKYKERTDQ